MTRYNTSGGFVILDKNNRVVESTSGLVKGSLITKSFIKALGWKKQRQTQQVFANGSTNGNKFI